MCGTNQFVLLQVESLQFAAPFSQSHHAFICDTVALTQVDVFQLTAVFAQLKAERKTCYIGTCCEYSTKHHFTFNSEIKRTNKTFALHYYYHYKCVGMCSVTCLKVNQKKEQKYPYIRFEY